MDHAVLLFVTLLPSISIINGQMQSFRYEVVDQKMTWTNALQECTLRNGTLIDSSEFNAVSNVSAQSSYWTGNFQFMTRWVQLKGCFSGINTNKVSKCLQFDHSDRPLGWSCYMFCYKYEYFGITEPKTNKSLHPGFFDLKDDVCKCISGEPEEKTSHNECPACNDSSRYQCGKGIYTAVYEIRHNLTISENDDTKLCASYNCNPGDVISFSYQGNGCDQENPAICSDNTRVYSSNWDMARSKCETMDAYILQFPINQCNSSLTAPFWDNIHRDIVSLTTQFEVLNGLNMHDHHQLRQCSFVKRNDSGQTSDKCSNAHQHEFICKIGNFTNDNTTTLCNITETEADQTPTYTTGNLNGTSTDDGTTTIYNLTTTAADQSPIYTTSIVNSNINTTVSYQDQKMENNTNGRTYIAIGAGVGGLLVVILVVIIIVYTCRKRSYKNNTDETGSVESYEKKEIDIDDGQENHIVAAERYISIKSEQASVKYTTENSKVTTKTSGLGEAGDRRYEQIHLPCEEPDSGFQDGIVDNIKETQPNTGIHQTSNSIQNTEEEDDYAVVDNESVTEGDIPEIRLQTASIKTTKISDQQEMEDDYDHFKQSDQRQSVSSNYDHVHLRNSGKSSKGSSQDDFEDYDHFPGAGGRRRDVESTYDHTKTFGLRASNASMSSNYDHVTLLANQNDQDDALNRVSDDYDHTTNVSKVEVVDGNRDSNYTQVILPDSN